MPALTDAEILAGLPDDARKKIDNAFEALAQALPSDRERLILYRVATALKLNPTDTHFSVMAAMHYYLQLYQVIPDKISEAGGKIILAGEEVDAALRRTLSETLTQHTSTLNAQSELLAQKTRADLIGVVGDAAQKIAKSAFAHERQKSQVQAVAAVSIFALVTFVAGLAVGNSSLSTGWMSCLSFVIGLSCGIVCAYLIFENDSGDEWTPNKFLAASLAINLPDNVLFACRDVLVHRAEISDAAWKHRVSASEVENGVKKFLQLQ